MLSRLFRRHPDADDPIVEAFTNLDAEWEVLAKLPPPTLIEAELGKSLGRLGELRNQEASLDAQIAGLQDELRQVRKVLGAEQLKASGLAVEGQPANITPIRKSRKEAAE